MHRRLSWMLICLLAPLGPIAGAQAPRLAATDHPTFEVATVKPNDSGERSQGWFIHGRSVEIHYQTVASLMMFAYGIHPKQIVDGPAWMNDARWDIRGTADLPGEPSHTQMQEMLKGLLADRFGLKVRREGREMPAYTVTIAKGGPKLTPSKSEPDAQSNQDAGRDAHGLWLRMTNVDMPQFDLYMQFFTDRPVVDHTGLPGRYDVMLTWKPAMAATASPEDYPELIEAAQEQLGLKLTPEKAVVEALVVERVEQPSAN